MGLHERAWAGIEILVFGTSPMVPMKIEVALGSASPGNEVRISSFEKYDDAFNFAKDKKNIGFIFILENSGSTSASNVFSQLSSHYESRGWPCFGILLHENGETLAGLKAIKNELRFIDYLPVDSVLDKSKVYQTLSDVWMKFTKAFETKLIPLALQESFLAVADPLLIRESNTFITRVATILSADLNISWIESVALSWFPTVNAIRQQSSCVLAPHTVLQDICKLADPSFSKDLSLIDIFKANASLCARISACAQRLNEMKLQGTLIEAMLTISTQMKPGAPALLKSVARQKDLILEISVQTPNELKKVWAA